jgi:hypothetical protein
MDLEVLRREYSTASPFPFFKIDNFMEDSFARSVVASYPSYETARAMGREFKALNERLKIQVTDRSLFPEPVGRLSDELASPDFLRKLEFITGIPALRSDDLLSGGGMHLTASGGRLDVHVDFNFIPDRALHRRLNILVYLNDRWDESWGGNIELWDKDVRHCGQSFSPLFNRCVVFETSEFSYHGVTPVRCPDGVLRRSFAAYYYTSEPPAGWDGAEHSTVFRARPNEVVRGKILMPVQRAERAVEHAKDRLKKLIKKMLGLP